MQKLPFQFDDGLILYQKPIPVRSQNQFEINAQPPQGKPSLRGILNVLIPPKLISKQIKGKKQTYAQYVDEDQVQRKDVDRLKQKMEQLLKIRKAKIQPICPIRQQIFAEAFTQIIRQVLIDCPQRGIMLSRVRNQAYLSLAAYRSLYQESLKFSKNKLVESQQNITALQNQQEQFLQKQSKLKEREMYLLLKKQALQQKSRQIRIIYKEKRQQQLHSLSIQHQGLQNFIFQVNKLKQQEEAKQRTVIKKLQQNLSQKKENN